MFCRAILRPIVASSRQHLLRQQPAIGFVAPLQQQQDLVFRVVQIARFSDNITYSGGQASEGQGGYYASFHRASGGEMDTVDNTETQRKNVLAMAADVQKIAATMKELDTLEGLLQRETDPTTGRSIELKASIKKLMTNPEVFQALDRLETTGGLKWGLSREERDMILEAREKVKNS